MPYLSEKQVAIVMGLSVLTLRKWRWKKTGPAFVKLEGRSVRYDSAVLQAYLAERGGSNQEIIPPPEPPGPGRRDALAHQVEELAAQVTALQVENSRLRSAMHTISRAVEAWADWQAKRENGEWGS